MGREPKGPREDERGNKGGSQGLKCSDAVEMIQKILIAPRWTTQRGQHDGDRRFGDTFASSGGLWIELSDFTASQPLHSSSKQLHSSTRSSNQSHSRS